VEEILNQAERLEKEYDWLGAADSYEKALNLLPEDDFSGKSETYERLGYAFYRAAFQAQNNDEFRERLRQAIADYEKARECYHNLNEPNSGRLLRCNAMNLYINYWLVPEAGRKKKLLDDCWRFAQDSLKASRESENAQEHGKTFNLLSTSALLLCCMEDDYQAAKKIIEELIAHGEVGIELLSTTEERDGFAKACAKTAFALSTFAYYFQDIDERQNCIRKAQSYWTKAKETSQDSANLEMLCPIPCAHDLLLGFGSAEIITNLEKALEQARRTKDKFLIGSAFDWLTYHTTWATSHIDDYDEIQRVVKKIIQYAEDAKRQYSVIAFMSPRTDNVWVEAINLQVFLGYTPEKSLAEKRVLLERAIAAGRRALEPAEKSGYPGAKQFVNLHLSTRLRMLAESESSSEEKRKLLEEALQHGNEALRIGEKIEPLSYWDLGILRGVLAETKCDLANLATEPGIKKSLLQAAILERENAIKLLVKDLSHEAEKKVPSLIVVASSQYSSGIWQSRLYRLTGDKDNLRKALEALNEALELMRKLNRKSGLAECYWKIAQTYGELGDHLAASRNFRLASDNFRSAPEKLPQLKSFYEDHAVYMQAWSEIEKARGAHERQEYGLAMEHFEKAAELHKLLKKWSYLKPNYSAWAQVEKAEDLSRKEESEEAIKAFEGASDGFGETRKSLQSQLRILEDVDEKQMVTSMIDASDLRRKYCDARAAIEEARILDKEGNHYASSEKYGSAAETFERISEALTSDVERREFRLLITLSHAWQKMTLAESEAAPALYAEASQLFEDAKNFTQNDKTKMLMLGHSRFCRALEAGTEFADTRDARMHANATKYLESAASYYVKAGFQKSSDYAEATGLLLDAYMHMDNAKEEKDPEKKGRMFAMAETVLQTAAGSFLKAEHPEKREQVLGMLEKVKKEKELALSFVELLHAPTVVSATTSFTSPAPTREEAVGSERFEHADIQANLIIRQRELKIGENLGIELELVNAGKGAAVLTKITEIIPKGFEVAEKPETYRVEDSFINLKGKRLDPLKTEEVKIVLKPTVQGTFSLKPNVLYLDENGKYKSHEPDPVTITVKELGIKGWLKGEK
jgi:uncharacterized DUF497 family protein